jgi:threonine/homoserine/homoserine lactone efflux protein
MYQTLLATTGLLLAGAITPGPNNFVVLREAARGGWRGALPAIAGVVAGSLALLLLATGGAGAALAAVPRLAPAIATAGGLYLAWLGIRLIASRPRGDGEESAASDGLPAGTWGLFVFQFLNPKAWLLALTVTASVQPELGTVRALPTLAVLFAVVPALCLGLWAWAGVALARRLERPEVRIRLDRTMGSLLSASALLLLIDTWR